MEDTPAISIVVPAYNEEQLIGRCLESLKKQDFTLPYEIIVVNNNSTDKTETIAKSFGVKIISENTQSVVAARQRGLVEAKGIVVVGADCDCVYPPQWLTNIYRHYKDSNVVAVGGPAIGEKNPYWAHLIYRFGFGFVGWWYRLTKSVYYLGGFNFSFRRQTFLDIGGYNTKLDFGGDEWDPLARLKKKGKIIFDPEAFMYVGLRRYRVGFIKWFFIHNLYYYVLNYQLARLFKRVLIRAKPVRNI